MKSLRLFVTLVAGLLIPAALLTSADQGGRGAQPAQPQAHTKMMMQSDAAVALKQDMRKLWTYHVVWTRLYIIAAVGDQPDAQAAANRLMKNQDDLGNAVAKYYGDAAGKQMTTLLKQHITIAVDLIKAAKAGNKDAQKQA